MTTTIMTRVVRWSGVLALFASSGAAAPRTVEPGGTAGTPASGLSTSTYLEEYVEVCSAVPGASLPRPTHVRHFVPPSWEAGVVDWVRDQSPQNKIDDRIDADTTSATFDVLLAYRRPPTAADVNLVESLDPGIVVDDVGQYVPYLQVSGVPPVHVATLSALPEIAFVERQFGFAPLTEVTAEGLKVAAGFYSPNTVDEAFPGIDGSGVNVAIMDSGVQNVTHPVFASTVYYPEVEPDPQTGLFATAPVVGYNALTGVVADPFFPDFYHGTFVASVALGQAWTDTNSQPARGIATRAGLIDVLIFDLTTNPVTCEGAEWADATHGLDFIYERHLDFAKGKPGGWKVDIVNMSFRQCDPNLPPGIACTQVSDGTDVFSKLVDLAVEMGIVVVAAAGNDGCVGCQVQECLVVSTGCSSTIGTPAAASRAIAVGATYDQNTADRTDDVITCFSTYGPRANDGDLNLHDELKPEVVAPGEEVSAALKSLPPLNFSGAFGTSIASPHVSGVAALVKQFRPEINPASVRNVLIRSAEPLGAPSLPAVDPTWNDHWGWGLVDAHEALVQAQPVADPKFVTSQTLPPWLSSELSIAPFPFPKPGIINTVTAHVFNSGPGVAEDVDVLFGVSTLTPTPVAFEHIGTGRIASIPVGESRSVSIEWRPMKQKHAAISAEIGFGGDTDYSNNRAKLSFAAFNRAMTFPVQNLLSATTETIELEVSCMAVPGGSTAGWTATLTPATLVMGGNERPQPVVVEVQPPPGTPGGRILVEVVARIEGELVGGMTLEGIVPAEPAQGMMAGGFAPEAASASSAPTTGTETGLLDPAWFAQIVLGEGGFGTLGAGQ